MIKTPTKKVALSSITMGAGAGAGVFLGKALNSHYPTDGQKSAGLKLATSIVALGMSAVVSANMPKGAGTDALVGMTTGFGAEKLVSAVSDYMTTTDALAESNSTNVVN